MKRLNILFATILIATASAFGATDYGLTVGGVDVTSDNCTNVTGDNIKPNLSGEFYVKYDPSTKTLTLKNIKIERSGSYNRAILNNDVDGLKIVFIGKNLLKAEDSSPVRLNNNTTITTQDSNQTEIIGGSEDAITVGDGKTLIFDHAYIQVSATKSSALEGNEGTETVIIQGGSDIGLSVLTEADSYTLNDLNLFKVDNSFVYILHWKDGNFATKVKSFQCIGDYMGIINGEYVASSQNFVCKEGVIGTDGSVIYICKAVLYNDTKYFPDKNFAQALSELSTTNTDYKNVLILPCGFNKGRVRFTTSLDLSFRNISSLKGIEFFTDLVELNCMSNKLANVDLSKNTALKTLNMSDNTLSSITLPQTETLTTLLLNNNLLTSVDLTKNTGLTELNVSYNNLMSLNVSKNTALTTLTANSNTVRTISLPQSTTLTTLNVNSNALTSIDVSNCTALTNLYLGENQLTALDVSKNTKLKEIECHSNRFTTLDFSKNSSLRKISCYYNQIYDVPSGAQNGESFVANLPNIYQNGFNHGDILFTTVTDANNLTKDQVSIASSKGWSMKFDDGSTYSGTASSAIEEVEVEDCDNDNAPRYNLKGQPVDDNYRGIVIQKGKKILVK